MDANDRRSAGLMLSVGECFAGIGGFGLGLEAAGVGATRWYSEIVPACNRVMAARFPTAEPMGDIEALTDGLFGPEPVDIVSGGPPCNDISKGNAYGRLGLAGIKSGLFHAYAEVLEAVSPRWVLMEQVTGLLSSGETRGADYALVHRVFKDLGYELAVVHVNSRRYVPQTRDRLYFVGSREPGAAARAVLPLVDDGARVVAEGGQGSQRITSARVEGSPGCYRKSRRPQDERDGETWVPADYANTLTLYDVGVARATVIVVDSNGRPRVMTPEEWEGCHGFPRGWTEPAGSDGDRWRALGNAVSPPITERLGAGIAAVERAGA